MAAGPSSRHSALVSPAAARAETAVSLMFPQLRRALGLDQSVRPSKTEEGEWQQRALDYQEWYKVYSSEYLEELDRGKAPVEGRAPYKWPLRINPVAIACRLHQQALIGEVRDQAETPALVLCEPRVPKGAAELAIAERANEFLRQVEYENGLTTVDAECMLLTQVWGGVVQRVVRDREAEFLPTQIRVEWIDPGECWFRWHGSNYWHPTEAWLKRTISKEDAKQYGVTFDTDEAEYLEHWKTHERHITVDGKPASFNGEQLYGDNPYKFTPFLYLPHVRGSEAWGESFVPGAVGILEEFNSRLADLGDWVFLGVHDYPVMSNVRSGYPVEKHLPDGRPVLDAGSSGPGKQSDPKIDFPARPGVPEPAVRFAILLLNLLRLQMMTTDAAYGQLEGTQRSGQTVHSLNLVMHQHVNLERMFWTQALVRRAEMILRLGVQYSELPQEVLGLRKRAVWSPQVPLDRMALVNELTTRISDGSISPTTAMEKYGDVPNIEQELERVLSWKEQIAPSPQPPTQRPAVEEN